RLAALRLARPPRVTASTHAVRARREVRGSGVAPLQSARSREVAMAVDVDQARSIFLAAIEEDPHERPAFLDGACGGGGELRARVERLLEAHQALGSIYFQTIPGPDADAGGRSSEGPGSVIGPYKLLEAIGEGGMGTVYMAEQERPVRRRVALKIIKPGMDSTQVIARFEAERQAPALRGPPHLPPGRGAGTL